MMEAQQQAPRATGFPPLSVCADSGAVRFRQGPSGAADDSALPCNRVIEMVIQLKKDPPG